jgi:ABC-type branched-subunit amino acid transport system ATPase component
MNQATQFGLTREDGIRQLNDGKVLVTGTPQEVAADPAVQAA